MPLMFVSIPVLLRLARRRRYAWLRPASIAFALFPATGFAQGAADPASIWTLQEENAALSAGIPRDHFYTNGLRVAWTSPTGEPQTMMHDFGEMLWGPATQRMALEISQQINTPADTHVRVPGPNDQPYAGVLTGGLSLIGETQTARDTLTLRLGAVGPLAGGEEIQNGFHDLIHRPPARGWSNQIPNTRVGEVIYGHVWRVPGPTAGDLETDLLPAVAGSAGTLRDSIKGGVAVRIGQGLQSDFGVSHGPQGPGGMDAYTPPARAVAWYAFAGLDGEAVAYDLLLQSAPFRGGPHVSPNHALAAVYGGIALMTGAVRVTAAYVADTPAFHGQCGGLHRFASVSLSVRF